MLPAGEGEGVVFVDLVASILWIWISGEEHWSDNTLTSHSLNFTYLIYLACHLFTSHETEMLGSNCNMGFGLLARLSFFLHLHVQGCYSSICGHT